MREFIFLGIAAAAAAGTFFLLAKKTGSDCVP
jgi:hypothetical protein